jgi:hypothetical protein
MECQGPARLLGGVLESEFKSALGVLEQKILALEAYLALTAPSGTGQVSPGAVAATTQGHSDEPERRLDGTQ